MPRHAIQNSSSSSTADPRLVILHAPSLWRTKYFFSHGVFRNLGEKWVLREIFDSPLVMFFCATYPLVATFFRLVSSRNFISIPKFLFFSQKRKFFREYTLNMFKLGAFDKGDILCILCITAQRPRARHALHPCCSVCSLQKWHQSEPLRRSQYYYYSVINFDSQRVHRTEIT